MTTRKTIVEYDIELGFGTWQHVSLTEEDVLQFYTLYLETTPTTKPLTFDEFVQKTYSSNRCGMKNLRIYSLLPSTSN